MDIRLSVKICENLISSKHSLLTVSKKSLEDMNYKKLRYIFMISLVVASSILGWVVIENMPKIEYITAKEAYEMAINYLENDYTNITLYEISGALEGGLGGYHFRNGKSDRWVFLFIAKNIKTENDEYIHLRVYSNGTKLFMYFQSLEDEFNGLLPIRKWRLDSTEIYEIAMKATNANKYRDVKIECFILSRWNQSYVGYGNHNNTEEWHVIWRGYGPGFFDEASGDALIDANTGKVFEAGTESHPPAI